MVLKGPRRGQPLSVKGMDEILAAARRRAGLEHATCHELRHTCLTRLREAGMALEAVQAQAGHASIESTRIYLHLADDWLAAQYRKAAEVIDAQVFAGQPPGPPSHRELAVSGRRSGAPTGWARCRAGPTWSPRVPQIAATMRRYLTQIGCVLRPGSVGGADLALRSLRRLPGRDRARGDQHRTGHPPPHRGLQALARRPSRAEQAPADHRDHRPPAGHAADVLRPPR